MNRTINRTVVLSAALLFALSLHVERGLAQSKESVRLDSSENMFAVLAAINMAGYDADLTSPNNSPLRAEVRRVLGTQSIPVLEEIRLYYKHHQRYNTTEDLSQYVSLALSVISPTDTAWRTRDVEVPLDAMAIEDFRPLLTRFYRQANIESIWNQVRPLFDKEEQRYHAGLLSTTTLVNSYLRAPSGGYLGRNFRVWMDLLAAPNQVQTRNYGDDAFVVVTHACQPKSDTDPGCTEPPKLFDIRHAYLHYQIDPLVIKWGMALANKKSLADFARGVPALEDRYKDDYVLLATESLIKAVEAKLDKRPDTVMASARQGFILTPVFYEQLATYEAQQQGLRFFLPDMIDAIDPAKETKRLDSVKFDKTRPVTTIRTVKPAAPKASAAAKLIAQADALAKARSLDDARGLYLKALEQNGEPGEHAQAWYGLAKVAALKNEPDNAFKLFEKSLGAQPDDWTKAWANVYLGRLAKAAKDFESASKYYSAALAVGSEPAKEARQAAETESAAIPKK